MRSHANSEVCAPDKCCSSLDMLIPLSASKRATTSPYAGDSINSTTRLPKELLDRAFPKCAATSPSTVPLATQNTRDQRRGVPSGRALGQGSSTEFDSYVLFSAKSMLEVWATSRRWYPITSLWKLPCCKVLLLQMPYRGLGFTQACLQERWRRT